MKKFRVLAALICSVMILTSLSACTGSTDEPSEASTEASEVVETTGEETSEEPGTEPTEETSGESETEAPAQGEIIRLWNTMTVDDSGLSIYDLVTEESMDDLFSKDFLSGIGRYWFFLGTGTVEDGHRIFQLDTPWNAKEVLVTDTATQNPIEIKFYFYGEEGESTLTRIEANGASETGMFLPLWYDTGRQCVVGYRKNAGKWSLIEFYWDTQFNGLTPVDVEDPSVYGF